jgi:uracil-DNA glycosylase
MSYIHQSWQEAIKSALLRVDPGYLKALSAQSAWLPGSEKLFNAFSLPKSQVKVILLGESPYPRQESANGYAFWDAAVDALWSETGLSKTVNCAISLRNFIKMLLVADKLLKPEDTGQPAIQALDKTALIQTNQELFGNLLGNGFLLLNTSLVFRPGYVKEDAKAWQPFIETILTELIPQKPLLLLLGRVAETLSQLNVSSVLQKIIAPHPYNLSFIQDPQIINFFRPLTLLRKKARMN